MIELKIMNKYYKISDVAKLSSSMFRTLRHPKKVANLIHSFYGILRKDPVVKSKPFGLMVEPTIKCNLKCPMCVANILNPGREGGYFKVENFKKVVDEIGDYLIFLQFWFFGEPLMNPNLFELIKYAKSKDIFTVVTSNMQLLTPNRAKEMIDSGLDYLNVSFNGGSEKSYNTYMLGGSFERVVRNIKLVIEERKKQKKKFPFVDLQCIIMKETEPEIEKIKEIGRNLGVDRVSFKTCTITTDMNSELLPENPKYRLSSYKKEGKVNRCQRLWYLPVINWDGTLVSCCNDVKYQNRMGNAFTNGLNAIWNSNEYVNFRKQIIEDMDKIPLCKNCAKMKYKRQFINV